MEKEICEKIFQQKRKVKERFQLLVLQQWCSLQGLRGCALHSEQLLSPKIQSSDGDDDGGGEDGGGDDDDGGVGDEGGGEDESDGDDDEQALNSILPLST